MKCFVIKLINGETLMASIVNKDETHVYINNPILIEFNSTSYGNVMYSTHWIPLNGISNILPINSNHIITYAKASDSMSDFYERTINKITSTEEPEENEPELEPDMDRKMQEYRNKIKLIRTPAANTMH